MLWLKQKVKQYKENTAVYARPNTDSTTWHYFENNIDSRDLDTEAKSGD